MLDVADECRQHGRVVRQVGVELHAHFGAAFDGVREPGPVGGAEAVLGVALEHDDPPDPVTGRRERCAAVPSGLASSTTTISASGRAARIRSHTSTIVPASL